MWSEVDVNFMTDESSAESDNEVKQHKLPWRSQSGSNYFNCFTVSLNTCIELNQLIHKLDSKCKDVEMTTPGFRPRNRIQSTPSLLIPPLNAPLWTISEAYHQPIVNAADRGTPIQEPMAMTSSHSDARYYDNSVLVEEVQVPSNVSSSDSSDSSE